jgi:hypothetical protein
MVLLVRERLERPGLVRLRRQLVSSAEARAVKRRSRDFATTQAQPAIVIRNQNALPSAVAERQFVVLLGYEVTRIAQSRLADPAGDCPL